MLFLNLIFHFFDKDTFGGLGSWWIFWTKSAQVHSLPNDKMLCVNIISHSCRDCCCTIYYIEYLYFCKVWLGAGQFSKGNMSIVLISSIYLNILRIFRFQTGNCLKRTFGKKMRLITYFPSEEIKTWYFWLFFLVKSSKISWFSIWLFWKNCWCLLYFIFSFWSILHVSSQRMKLIWTVWVTLVTVVWDSFFLRTADFDHLPWGQ